MPDDKVVVIDGGHGGTDPGAIGPTGVQEKIITLKVAHKVAAKLLGTAKVILTRESDKLLAGTIKADLAERYKKANQANADVFISIQCNSAANSAAHGAEVFSSRGNTKADRLATLVIDAMEKDLSELTYRKDYTDGDADIEAGFAVLNGTGMPAILVELAFVSNPTEEALLESDTFQDKAAQAIAEGVAKFLGVELKSNKVQIHVGSKVLDGVVVGSVTLARVREFGNALGVPVSWDGTSVSVGGVKVVVRIIDGVSYAPVRYLAESLGKNVNWDGRKVVII